MSLIACLIFMALKEYYMVHDLWRQSNYIVERVRFALLIKEVTKEISGYTILCVHRVQDRLNLSGQT